MPLSKQELRAAMRARKKAMPPQEIALRSTQLCKLVLQSEAYQTASSVYGYLPFNQEVDLLPLLRQAICDGKQVALPKCCAKELLFIRMQDLSRIQSSAFGAPEPVDDGPVAVDKTALVIVPGLAFDRQGYRVGYGGGYYDRFLSREPGHPTIALCYDFQLVERLEAEPHDIPVGTVFSV